MAVAAPQIGVIEVASGKAHVGNDIAMTRGHRLLLASSTKTFVATVVLVLIEDGALSLDNRLDNWFPDVPNAAQITIRQLLSHTSGIPDYLTPENRLRFATTALERQPVGGPGFTPDELFDLASTMQPAFEPDASFAYSNSNTVLLGAIVEAITGAPLHEVLQERLFAPLGLESFHIAGVEPAPSAWGPGYTFEYAEVFGGTDGPLEFDQHMSMLIASTGWASGALVGTAGDAARFQQALVHGETLQPATLAEMVAPSPVLAAFVQSVGAPEIGGGMGVLPLSVSRAARDCHRPRRR